MTVDLNARSRRHFLRDCGLGAGTVALAGLLNPRLFAETADPLAPRPPHFAPRAKRMIHLFMAGGPSHLDLFDPKPLLTKYHGQPLPESVIRGQRYAFIRRDAAVLGSSFRFARHGRSGAELSELLPHLATVADDIALVRSLHTDQ